jgi:CRP-like cAMP-binding protein
MFRRSALESELGHVPLLDGLSHRSRELVARLTTPVDVPAGTVLAEEGAPGIEFFIVLQGRVDVVRDGTVIATRGPGCHLGEIALLRDQPRTATLVTTTPVRTRVASRREFSSIVAELPTVSARLQESVAERLAA